jgi:pyruvate/2-oxoglutarate dehydrogenase complex dihydrolipoamide dehydrogenase (E3) component
MARRGEEFGFRISGLEVDWTRIRARKDALVSSIVTNLERSLKENPRIELVRGSARFLGPKRIEVGGRAVQAERVIVASGVAPVVPDIPGLLEAGFETNETVMDMKELPRSMVVIGGGAEGMEFSQMLHRFGVRMTVLQRAERVLPKEDEEISRELEGILREEGVDIRTGARPERVERGSDGKLTVVAHIKGRAERIACDKILVTAGRRPHALSDMDLGKAGVEGTSERGIAVDQTLKTSAGNIWAIGDVIGRMQYTHFATYTAGIAVGNALSDAGKAYETGRVPGAVFTDPEVASVGITEREAIAQGRKVKVGKQALKGVARARAMGETAGFIKFVVDAQTDELLGMHVLAHIGADLLPQGILLLNTEGRKMAPMTSCICVHPTFSEGVKAAATSLKPIDSVTPPGAEVG